MKNFKAWLGASIKISFSLVLPFCSLVFAAYVISKKNYSIGRVVFFIFQTKLPTLFLSAIKDSGRLWTTRFSSSRFGVRVTALPKFLNICSLLFSIPEISEKLRGSPTKFFGAVREKIFDGKSWYPPFIHKLFGYRKISETQKGSPTKFFRHCETKKIWQIIVILPPSSPPSLLSKKFFDTRSFVKRKRGPDELFGTVRRNFFKGKSWYLFA